MFQIRDSQRGSALYIAFIIMSALLALALGISALLLGQLGILKGIGHSVFAFYATDAGVERALYIDNSLCAEEEEHAPCLNQEFENIGAAPPDDFVSLSNGAQYQLIAESGGEGNCPSGRNYCVRSLGVFKEAQRAVRVAR